MALLLKYITTRLTLIIVSFAAVLFLTIYGIILYWPQDNEFQSIKVTIPKGATLNEIADSLERNNILSNKKMFLMAVRSSGHEKDIPAGRFTFTSPKDNSTIIEQLINGSPLKKKVTLLEGWTVRQVARHLSQTLGIDEDEFIHLCFDEQFVRQLGIPGNSAEGFLFPDTYYFFEEEDARSVIRKLVDEYRKVITQARVRRAQELKLSELEWITLASIIEGEAIYDDERSRISGVYHNRLDRDMRLQADPTIQYIVDGSPRRLLNKDLKIESPYNTYLNKGLPPGPINNPGRESIVAALYPENNEYLYFVARGDGYHTFSKNQREHNIAKRKFQKIRREVWREKMKESRK